MHRPISPGPRRRARRALLAAALPAALAAAALPSAADAATVELVNSGGNGVVRYSGEPGEANNVRVELTDRGIVIDDASSIRSLDSECTTPSTGRAICPASAESILVFTGDGNDTIQYKAPHSGFVSGGDGADIIFGGLRQAGFGRQIQGVIYRGKDRTFDTRQDTVSYRMADRGVRVDAEPQITPPGQPGVADDGRPGIDFEHVSDDIEVIEGSNFDDTLFGSTGNDVLVGLNGNDVVGGGEGADFIQEGSAPNGADTLNGGNGTEDTVNYGPRTSGVNVTLDGLRNDGATGERDDVRPNVENVTGSNHADVLIGNGSDNALTGLGGDDRIDGRAGDDNLSGGTGTNHLFGGVDDDFLEARFGSFDEIDCGSGESDRFDRDNLELSMTGCEIRAVGIGTLRLAPKALQATAGKPTRLRLSWRHPQSWRKLRKVELRLTRNELPVGEITIRPRGERITADGAVKLARKRTRLTHKGKTVTARLAVQLDASLTGQELTAEVEATDTRGTRQLERNAATVRVAP
jgi:Ca2+-binding RTX toxin-like protein